MSQTTMSPQKAQEQRAGRAFIKDYNEHYHTDYEMDVSYTDEFPDLRFTSKSQRFPNLQVEVVQVVQSEMHKAKTQKVVDLEKSFQAAIKKMDHVGVFVGIHYMALPNQQEREALIYWLSRYVDEKIQDLRKRRFNFDKSRDTPIFWDKKPIKTLIRSIRVSLVKSESVHVVLIGEDEEIFPQDYIESAIRKKRGKYPLNATQGLVLLLDCDFPLIDEGDLEAFAANAAEISSCFAQIWCVNILADRTIVEQLA